MSAWRRTRPQAPAAPDRLKLRARDAEDLQAISTCLQDAVVPVSEITYLKPERRFVMVANRFRWEAAPRAEAEAGGEAPPTPPAEPTGDAPFAETAEGAAGPLYERVNCGVCFERVKHVRLRALDLQRKGALLNLLALEARPGAIDLVFSGGAQIRLEVSEIRCYVEDLGEPWPTRWHPMHPAEADEAPQER